jgi:hypothetical protein
MNFNLLSQWHVRHYYFMIKYGYLPIPLTTRFSRRQKISLVEVCGFGKAKGLNRLFPSRLALSKRMLGISPAVE